MMKKVLIWGIVFFVCLSCIFGETIIIDNKSAKFLVTGPWSATEGPKAHGSDYRETPAQAVETASATWNADFETSGTFDVSIWFAEEDDRTTDALYIVNHAGGEDTATKDQTTSGSEWILIGTYTFLESGGSVVLSNQCDEEGKTVCADAVRFVREGAQYERMYQGMWIYSWGLGFLSAQETKALAIPAGEVITLDFILSKSAKHNPSGFMLK